MNSKSVLSNVEVELAVETGGIDVLFWKSLPSFSFNSSLCVCVCASLCWRNAKTGQEQIQGNT